MSLFASQTTFQIRSERLNKEASLKARPSLLRFFLPCIFEDHCFRDGCYSCFQFFSHYDDVCLYRDISCAFYLACKYSFRTESMFASVQSIQRVLKSIDAWGKEPHEVSWAGTDC